MITLYEKAIKLDPDNAQAHYNLANVFSDMGKNDKAIALYKRAIEIKENYVVNLI